MWTPHGRQGGMVLRQVQVHAVGQVLRLRPDRPRRVRLVPRMLPRRSYRAPAEVLRQALQVSQVRSPLRVLMRRGGGWVHPASASDLSPL